MTESAGTAPGRGPAVAWDRSRFLFGVALVIPAVVVIAADPQLGLALAVGLLPAAGVAIAPARRDRWRPLLVSLLAGIGVSVGAVLGQNAVAAVLGLFGLSVAAALLTTRLVAGALVLLLAVPLAGLGLSFAPAQAVAFAGVMALSGAYASAVSLLWPESPGGGRPPAALWSRRVAVGYGLQLGSAAAVAAAVSFALDLDHKGWVCGAALLVMRPDRRLVVPRSLGRAASVFVGALAGSLFVLGRPSAVVIAVVVGLVITLMTATQASRWYVAPAFTTFVVFVLLLWDDPADTAWRFAQRNLETVLGVAIGLVFGLLVPLVVRRRTAR